MTTADLDARGRSLDRRAQSRAARADNQHIVVRESVFGHLKDSPIGPDAHGAQAHVEIARNPPRTDCTRRTACAAIQAAHAVISRFAIGRLGQAIAEAADQVPQRMAAERVARRAESRSQEHQRADADAEAVSSNQKRSQTSCARRTRNTAPDTESSGERFE